MSSGFPYTKLTVVNATTSTINNATFTSNTINTSGARGLRVICKLGAIAATATLTSCKLQSSAATGGTYVDVTGAALTTFPTDTSDNKLVVFEVENLNGDTKNLWYRVVMVNGVAADFAIESVIAELLMLPVEPVSTANTADFCARAT